MNKCYLIVFLFSTFLTSAQHFSGEIIYKTTIVPKNNTVNLDSIVASKKGLLSSYLITDHYYKSTSFKNDQVTYSYTYHGDTKRMYDDYPEKEYITYRDSRKANYEYDVSTIYRDSTASILGYDAYMVEHPASFGTTKTYYSDALQVNYETFKDHAVGNWYNKLKTVNGSITLKSITEFDEHIEVREAIKITAREVLRSEFDLPTSKPVVASGWALDIQPILNNPSEDSKACFSKKAQQIKHSIDRTKENKIYVTAILGKEGQLSHIKPYEKDSVGLWKVAVDILENCGFTFIPGEINGLPVASEIYIPFDFD